MAKQIKNKGGLFHGALHSEGGIPLIVEESGQHIETEKDEPLIPAEAVKDKKVKRRTGSNIEILNQINKESGAKGMDEVATEVHVNDNIICRRSAYDKTKRTYIGTDKSIVSAINESGGCKKIEGGAKMIEPNGVVKEFKIGGKVIKAVKLTKEEKEQIRQKRWVKKRARVQELANNIQRLKLNITKILNGYL
jgi:hypothetical protein